MSQPDRFALNGRVAVVTGASSGIGRAMAGFLAAAGARVVLVARRLEALERAAQAIAHTGGSAACVSVDLGAPELADDLAQTLSAPFGNAHILVNAAGINLREPIDDITRQSWLATLDLNLATPFFLARALVPGMRAAQYGRIINIASLQSERAFPNGLPYGASKGGVAQLTRAMAEAWSRDGIMANAIAPGFFPTELTAPVFNDPTTEQWAASQTTIGRNGEMEDLAGPTIFLASPASQYVTGQVLYVDGGFTAT
jgi:NAD(P)-dependent dehydrogenase (short-subunit alcohol dehydrogenase family)